MENVYYTLKNTVFYPYEYIWSSGKLRYGRIVIKEALSAASLFPNTDSDPDYEPGNASGVKHRTNEVTKICWRHCFGFILVEGYNCIS